MAGIIAKQMPPAQPSARPQPGAQPAQGVQRIIVAAMKAIHDPTISQQLIATMKSAGDPAQAIAQASMLVMKGLYEKAGKIPPQLIAPAMKKIILMVAELATTAKLFEVTRQTLQQAAQILIQQAKGGAPQAAPAALPAAPPMAAAQPMGV